MRRIGLLALTLTALVACVGKGKYKESQTALAAEQEASAAKQAELEQHQAQSDATIAELEAERDAAAAEVTRLNDEKAKMIADTKSLEASVAEMEDALAEAQERKAEADKAVRAFHDLVERFQALIESGKIEVTIVDGRMVVQLATDVLFSTGSATLSADGEKAIGEVGAVLADIPDRRYQVEGHTDNVPIATERFPSNWELASARSLVVVRELIEAGVAASAVSGASFGDTRPVAANDTPEGKSSNRRIEIVVVPDLSYLPGTEELEALSAAAEDAEETAPAETPAPAAPAPAAPAPAPAPTP